MQRKSYAWAALEGGGRGQLSPCTVHPAPDSPSCQDDDAVPFYCFQLCYSLTVFKLRHLSTKTLFSSIGPVVKSLLDTPVKCVLQINIGLCCGFLTSYRHRYFSFLTFERWAGINFLLPPIPRFCPTRLLPWSYDVSKRLCYNECCSLRYLIN